MPLTRADEFYDALLRRPAISTTLGVFLCVNMHATHVLGKQFGALALHMSQMGTVQRYDVLAAISGVQLPMTNDQWAVVEPSMN